MQGTGSKANAKDVAPKLFLKVPWDDRLIVKSLGAFWSPTDKSWYVPGHLVKDIAKFTKWMETAPPIATAPALPTTTPAGKCPAYTAVTLGISKSATKVALAPIATADGTNNMKKRSFSAVTPAPPYSTSSSSSSSNGKHQPPQILSPGSSLFLPTSPDPPLTEEQLTDRRALAAAAAEDRSKRFSQGGGGERLKKKAKTLKVAEEKNRALTRGENALRWH